jgi:hypothetical protein
VLKIASRIFLPAVISVITLARGFQWRHSLWLHRKGKETGLALYFRSNLMVFFSVHTAVVVSYKRCKETATVLLTVAK